MGFFGSTKKKTPSSKTKKHSPHHSFRHGASMKQMLRDDLREERAAAATSPSAAERHAEEAQYKGRGRARW